MRVTMVNKYYAPHIGGIEYHVRDLAEGLVSRGHDVRAIVANEGRATVDEDVGGVAVTRLARAFAYSSTPVAFGLPGALGNEATRSDPADVMHLHFPYPWGDFSWLRARPGLPTVLSYHSDIVRQKAMLSMYRPILERALDAVDLIVTGSPEMVEHSEQLSKRAEKCRVVPYGIDVHRFEATPEVEERARAIREKHKRPLVLFVGRLIYYKGAEVLVRAMREVDADLLIVGRGPLESELRELAVATRVSDRIEFLPPPRDEELVAYYHAADVLCLPSIATSEAFGIVQIEAHASGTPVVSTDLPTGVRFANKDGETGLIVPPGDPAALAAALTRILGDDALRERLGSQARERATRDFTIGGMVSRMIAVYDEACARRCGTLACGREA